MMTNQTQLYIKTPLLDMLYDKLEDKKIQFKMEAYQPTGSFKLRGIECACCDALSKGASHLLSSSGGNAGLAVSYVGQKLGVPVTVILPETSSETVINTLRLQGSKVIVYGKDWDEAHQYALSVVAQDSNTAYIPPFDHPKLWEGHATLVDELTEQCSQQPDLIILSVGGGGLLNGVIEGLVRNHWENTHVLAVETKGAESFYKSG